MSISNPSTLKAARTCLQMVFAVAAVIPVAVLALDVPVDSDMGKILALLVAAATVVTKIHNVLEDKGIIGATFYPKELPDELEGTH